MIPNANLNFTLDTNTSAADAMPAPVVWGLSQDEWVLPVGDGTLQSRAYIRNGLVCISWHPWGLVVVHPNLPVTLAPSEGSLFWVSCGLAFGMGKHHSIRSEVVSLYRVGLEIVCHALPLLAVANPDALTPRIVDSITKHGVVKGEYLCREEPPISSATESTTRQSKNGSAPRAGGKRKLGTP